MDVMMNLITKKILIAPEQRKSDSLCAIQLQKCEFQQKENFKASATAFHGKIFQPLFTKLKVFPRQK